MDYTITPSTDGKFIVLKIKGKLNAKVAMELNRKSHALGKEMQINRYLVDVTEAKNEDSIMGNYNFAYSDMQMTEGIDKFARVATLVSPNDHSHDFVETVSINAGLDVKLFTDIDQAKLFLIDG